MVFGKFLDVYIYVCVGLSCNLMYVGDFKKNGLCFLNILMDLLD